LKRLYTNGTDRWLTPPDLIEALGPFDTDPCCEPIMPWRTATKMFSLPSGPDSLGLPDFGPGTSPASSIIADGLTTPWTGRVWMNHPYSCGLPWALRMAMHGDGIALTASKSLDTEWGQTFLIHATLVLFPAGRILFRYPDGSPSTGKWLPNALWAFGEENADRLVALSKGVAYRGVCMRRAWK
jgi:hypothetical protein